MILIEKSRNKDPQDPKNRLSFPIPASGWKGFLFSLLFGLFVTIFLWFFQPFDINIQAYSNSEILFFGLISFTTFYLAHSVLPLIVPNIYKEKSWTIYSQILFYCFLSLIIATLNGIYINYRNDLDFSWSNYLLIIIQTFAVGIIPLTLAILFAYYMKYKRISEQLPSINLPLDRHGNLSFNQYTITSSIKNETLIIDDNTFLFAKSSGNYIEVFVINQSPKIYRMSLSNLEEQLAMSDSMIRCHRSFFVNTKQVIKLTGNAQGLKLWLKEEPLFVPVSRKYMSKVKSMLANF